MKFPSPPFGPTTLALAGLCLAVFGLPNARAQSVTADVDKAVIAEVAAHGEIMPNLTYLSDSIGARLTGSAALTTATEWAEAKMHAYGLQNVRREPYTIPKGWVRGKVTGRLLSPVSDVDLSMAAIAWTPGTPGRIQGPVIEWTTRSIGDIDRYKGKLKNAVILLQPPSDPAALTPATPDETSVDAVFNHPPARHAAAVRPGPTLSPQQQFAFFNKSVQLFKAEHVGAILLDSGRPLGLLMMFGGWEDMGPLSATGAPVIMVVNDQYALLSRLAADAALPGGKPARIELDDPSRIVPGTITCYNVVGDLPGTEKPNEYVVLGAHLDSWDLAQGTTDNGTGTCVVLEAARALVKSGQKPRRTIRFCLFTGEEEGDIGSTAFVKAHKDEMARTSMCLVDDAGTGKTVGVHTQAWSAIPAVFTTEAAATLNGLGFSRVVPGSPIPGGGGGSDHDSFEEVGVPGFILDQLDENYHLVFHSQQDTLDKADPAALTQTADILALLGLHVADLPGLLPRDKPAVAKP